MVVSLLKHYKNHVNLCLVSHKLQHTDLSSTLLLVSVRGLYYQNHALPAKTTFYLVPDISPSKATEDTSSQCGRNGHCHSVMFEILTALEMY